MFDPNGTNWLVFYLHSAPMLFMSEFITQNPVQIARDDAGFSYITVYTGVGFTSGAFAWIQPERRTGKLCGQSRRALS